MKPYDKTTHGGKVVDVITHQALCAVEKKLGYELTILQGSYNKGRVGASAGTHDGGGAVDLAPYDWERKVRALRQVGFAAWHRPAIPGVWGEHIHAILIGNQKLSPAAQGQVIDYRNRRDGLAGNGPDTFPFHPDGVVFKFVEPRPPTRGPRIDAAITDLRPARRAAKRKDQPKRLAKIVRAMKNLRAIKRR